MVAGCFLTTPSEDRACVPHRPCLLGQELTRKLESHVVENLPHNGIELSDRDAEANFRQFEAV